MKKNLLLILLAVATNCAVAQNVSKNGHQITPEPGDWGLGIDVNPFFQYFGNMFNGTQDNSAPGWDFTSDAPIPFTITGLMVKDETTAYRGRLRIGIGSKTDVSIIDQDGSTASPPATVEDELKTSSTNIVLGAGLQKTRGKHRVKGIYGAELLIGSGNGSKNEYTHGNNFNTDSLTIITPVPGAGYGFVTTTDWGAGPNNQTVTSSRTTEEKTGNTFYIGLRGFIGVEYFFAPKMSIAGEFGWGVRYQSTAEGEVTTESFDTGSDPAAFDDSIRSVTTKTGKTSDFGLDTDSGNPFSTGTGSLRMTFYF